MGKRTKHRTVRQEQEAFRLEYKNVAFLHRRLRGSKAPSPQELLRDANLDCIEQLGKRIRRAMAEANPNKSGSWMAKTRDQYVRVAVDREIKKAMAPIKKKYGTLSAASWPDEKIAAQLKLPFEYLQRYF